MTSAPTPTQPRPAERVFVIKLDGDAAPGHLSGKVEHVLSGWHAEFHGVEELQARLCKPTPGEGGTTCAR